MTIPKFEDEMKQIQEWTLLIKRLNELPDHDCHLSPDKSCEICERWYEYKRQIINKSNN